MGMSPPRDFDEAVSNYMFAANVYYGHEDNIDNKNLMARAINDFIKFSASEGKTVRFEIVFNSAIPKLLDLPIGTSDDLCQMRMMSFRI